MLFTVYRCKKIWCKYWLDAWWCMYVYIFIHIKVCGVMLSQDASGKWRSRGITHAFGETCIMGDIFKYLLYICIYIWCTWGWVLRVLKGTTIFPMIFWWMAMCHKMSQVPTLERRLWLNMSHNKILLMPLGRWICYGFFWGGEMADFGEGTHPPCNSEFWDLSEMHDDMMGFLVFVKPSS